MRFRPNWLSLTLGVTGLAALALPFASARQTRVAMPEPRGLIESFEMAGAAAGGVTAGGVTDWVTGGAVLAGFLLMAGLLAVVQRPRLRLALVALAVPALFALAGWAAARIGAGLGPYARVSPGAAVWVWLAVLIVAQADAQTRAGLGARDRVLGVLVALGGIGALAAAGGLNALSLMVEYQARAEIFARELRAHIVLALGSFVCATAIGVPLALGLDRRPGLRGPVLSVLTGIQTIPSIAMFGLMILPLGWLAAQVPLAAALGISGIGFAPAFLALLLYALLPVVANTLAGIHSVAPAVDEAARAMGMDARQRRVQVTLPLAAPVILTGARIVLVQNIGLATVGALIGAGGLGSFVFQGLAQGAMDLVLLGALPTVVLAVGCAAAFDALIHWARRGAP